VQLRSHYKQAYDLAVEQSTKPRMGETRRPFDRAFKDAITALRGRPDDPLAAPFLAAMQPLFNKPFDAAFKEAVAAQKAGLDKDRDNLQSEFEQAFNTALASKRVEKRPGGSAEVPIDPGERRKAIAHLLFNLTDVLAEDDVKREGSAAPGNKPLAGLTEGSPDYRDKVLDTEAYKRAYNRFVTVVGLTWAVSEAGDAADVEKRVAAELSLERGREQDAFALADRALVDLLQQQASSLEALTTDLARGKKQLDDQKALVARREKDVKQYQTELTESRQQTADRIKELRTMSQALYELRLRVRDAQGRNQEYERKIRKMERDR